MHSPEELWEELSPPPQPADKGKAPESVRSALTDLWRAHLNRALAANGQPAYNFDTLLLSEDAIGLSKAVTQLRRIRQAAIKTFAPEAAPFYRMHFAATDKQRRHFPKRVMTREEIQTATKPKGKPSMFYSGVQPVQLEEVMWDVLDQRFCELIGKVDEVVDVDAINPIGASGGAETQFIRFRMQLNAGVAHAFPVSKGEAEPEVDDKDILYCSTDILQGYHRSL
jgi:hypothetical protein